jgi:hypothetical protein
MQIGIGMAVIPGLKYRFFAKVGLAAPEQSGIAV